PCVCPTAASTTPLLPGDRVRCASSPSRPIARYSRTKCAGCGLPIGRISVHLDRHPDGSVPTANGWHTPHTYCCLATRYLQLRDRRTYASRFPHPSRPNPLGLLVRRCNHPMTSPLRQLAFS